MMAEPWIDRLAKRMAGQRLRDGSDMRPIPNPRSASRGVQPETELGQRPPRKQSVRSINPFPPMSPQGDPCPPTRFGGQVGSAGKPPLEPSCPDYMQRSPSILPSPDPGPVPEHCRNYQDRD